MKVAQAVDFHLQYHRANSKKRIPSKPVSLSSPVLQPSLTNVILPAYPLKRCWAFYFR